MSAAIASLRALAAALRAAPGFETAALATLRVALEHAAAATGPGDLLRAILHLRPESGYTGAFVLESGAAKLGEPQSGQAFVPSASAWREIGRTGRTVAVDVSARGGELSHESRMRLLQRGATHVLVVPMFGRDGPAGMISIEAAVLARAPAWDAVSEELEVLVALAAPALLSLPREASRTPAASGASDPELPVVGAAMAPVVRILRTFAAEEETLLIRGETGTGKSRLARWVHNRSPRRDGPFEVLDLLSVPAETQMGELFGWRRGAFTGASNDHDGFVARAEGGTLFIDEVDKLSLAAQAGLLGLLEERRYRVLGDRGTARKADVRFVAGTNADLRAEVLAGRFREDLYYRLDVLAVQLPPLRDRLDEVRAWATAMLERRHAEKRAAGRVTLSEEAAAALERRRWPGNLRELENALRRAYTLASAEAEGADVVIRTSHLGAGPSGASGGAVASAPGPLTALSLAARGLVTHLAAPGGPGGAVFDNLPLSGALEGLFLAHAVESTGKRDAAFELLGRGELVRNRNHHRALKREGGRAVDLFARLGEAVPPELAAVVDENDPEAGD